MRQTYTNKTEAEARETRLQTIAQAVNQTENPLYWLKIAVNQKELSASEAGYIIIKERV